MAPGSRRGSQEAGRRGSLANGRPVDSVIEDWLDQLWSPENGAAKPGPVGITRASSSRRPSSGSAAGSRCGNTHLFSD